MPVFRMDTIVPPVSDVSPTICGHISHSLWPYLRIGQLQKHGSWNKETLDV